MATSRTPPVLIFLPFQTVTVIIVVITLIATT
jgi:hypothetical protein